MKVGASTSVAIGCNSKSSVNSCDVGSGKRVKLNEPGLTLSKVEYLQSVSRFDDCSEYSGVDLACNCITSHFTTCGILDLNGLNKCLLAQYEELHYKDKNELKHFQQDRVASCIVEFNKERLKFGWHVFAGSSRISTCRNCCQIYYCMSKHVVDSCSANIRQSGTPSASNSLYYYDPQTNPMNGLTYGVVRDVIKNSVIDSNGRSVHHISHGVMQSVLQPKCESNAMCCAWLRDYCARFADQNPTDDTCFSPMNSKADVYDEYCNSAAVKAGVNSGIKVVCERTFRALWQQQFPQLKLRRSCNICGKCEVCSLIDAGSKNMGNCEATRQLYRDCKICHRVLYKGERKAAADRVLHALAYPSEILHVDIDIMDSQGLTLPHAGQQNAFSWGIKSVLVGALVAGVGATLYRTIDTYRKSSDLTCQVVLMEIEKFVDTHEKPPTIVYVNVDGGSENANTLTLLMCELLVAKGLALSIIFTRLPRGHTHNGPDGIFGIIKSHIRDQPMLTWESFKDVLLERLETSSIKLTITDIFFVFDYSELLKGCNDAKLSNFAKLEDTMHQWKFERCENNPWFPLNVMTMYRAFAADETIVTKIVQREVAQSSVGRKTGMDHYLLQVKWYPDMSTIEHRQVHGFYLLRDLPNVEPNLIKLKAFHADSKEDMENMLSFVRKEWPDPYNTIRQSWEKFFDKHMPVGGGTVDEFIQVKKMRYPKSPLRFYLADKRMCCSIARNLISPSVSSRIEYSPELLAGIAISMPSVTTEFDKNCLPPRLYLSADKEAETSVDMYFSSDNFRSYKQGMDACTVTKLKDMLFRKITRDGREVYPRSTTKAPLINSLCNAARIVMLNLQRKFVLEQGIFLESLLENVYRSNEEGSMELRMIGNYKIDKNLLRSKLGDIHVGIILQLFENEDNDKVRLHHDLYSRVGANMIYVPYVRSTFLVDFFNNPRNIDLSAYHSVYLAYKAPCGIWIIIVVDRVLGKYRIMLPVVEQEFNIIPCDQIATLLNMHMYPTGFAAATANYTCEIFKTMGLGACDAYDRLGVAHGDTAEHSIVYLFVFLLLASRECPLVLRSDDVNWFRKKLLYSICCGAFYF